MEASRAVREVSRAVPRGFKGRQRGLKSGPGGFKSRLGDLDEPPERPQDLAKRPLQPPGRSQDSPKRPLQPLGRAQKLLRSERYPRRFASVPRAHRAMDQPFEHTGLKGRPRVLQSGPGGLLWPCGATKTTAAGSVVRRHVKVLTPQSPQSHERTIAAHTARPIKTKGGFPHRGGRGGVNPSPKGCKEGIDRRKEGWK